MDHCDVEILQPKNHFKMADQLIKLPKTELPLDMAKHLFSFRFSLAETSVLKHNNALIYLGYHHQKAVQAFSLERRIVLVVYSLTWKSLAPTRIAI